MTSSKKPDLVTGATGFIGKHLSARLLRQKRHVRILCRKGSEIKLSREILDSAEIFYGDLNNKESLFLSSHGADRVFHCAGQVSDWGHKSDFLAVNVQGTQWLLEAAHSARVTRFVHLSSIAAFGTPSPSYFDDNSPYLDSLDSYSQSKALAEKTIFSFYNENKLPITILRPAVVYGPEGTWLEEPLKMIKQNKMFLLGGGLGTCHPCYIENLIDAILLAADHPRAVGNAYIVADDDPLLFKDYFNAVASIAGKGNIRKSIPLPFARVMASTLEASAKLTGSKSRPLLTHTAIQMVTTQSRMSMHKIKGELGFRPRYRFQDAIEELKKTYGKSVSRSHMPLDRSP